MLLLRSLLIKFIQTCVLSLVTIVNGSWSLLASDRLPVKTFLHKGVTFILLVVRMPACMCGHACLFLWMCTRAYRQHRLNMKSGLPFLSSAAAPVFTCSCLRQWTVQTIKQESEDTGTHCVCWSVHWTKSMKNTFTPLCSCLPLYLPPSHCLHPLALSLYYPRFWLSLPFTLCYPRRKCFALWYMESFTLAEESLRHGKQCSS